MRIASAQINSVIGEVNQNLETHYKMIDLAFKKKVDLIVFPEMSLTGYCREEAVNLAMTEFDKNLALLKQKSIETSMVIVVGAPIKINESIYIGSFIFCPDNSVKIYTKQFLHNGEELFYEPSFEYNPILEIDNKKISFAICADVENESHPQKASEKKSLFYLASIFYSKKGIDGGVEKLKNYAQAYSMNILMANYYGTHWNVESGGGSCFISRDRELIAQLKNEQQGLLVYDTETQLAEVA